MACYVRRGLMLFSDAIKEIRLKSMLSQREFADELSVSFTTVNRWENGKTTPNFKALKKIDDYCRSHGVKYNISEIYLQDLADK